MTTWEYKIEYGPFPGLVEPGGLGVTLTKRGEEGWELVTIYTAPPDKRTPQQDKACLLIFKRARG